jgi:hypothetical protein
MATLIVYDEAELKSKLYGQNGHFSSLGMNLGIT